MPLTSASPPRVMDPVKKNTHLPSHLPPLPAEILSTIFHHCTCLDGSLTQISTIDIPLLLTKICSAWRKVAINTQSLWSRLFLNIKPNAIHQTALASTWLARSGTSPLQIYIIWETPPFYDSHPVLDVLIQHSHHWRDMFLFIPFPAYESLGSIRGKLPILTELSLGTSDDTDTDIMTGPDPTPVVSDVFELAPHLQSVECVNLHPDSFRLPWEQLTKIPIMAVTVEDCLDILRRATYLQNGSFMYSGTSWEPVVPVTHTSLRELAILTAPWSEGVNIHNVFRLLSLPGLQSLRICKVRWPFGVQIAPFLSRIDALETLHIRKSALSEDDLLGVLRLVPALKHLTILSLPPPEACYTITSKLLDRLVWRPTGKSLVPRLETFEFTMYTSMGTSFVNLLESRWGGEGEEEKEGGDSPKMSRLVRVNAITDEEFGGEVMYRLGVLASAGMTIVIESTDRRE